MSHKTRGPFRSILLFKIDFLPYQWSCISENCRHHDAPMGHYRWCVV